MIWYLAATLQLPVVILVAAVGVRVHRDLAAIRRRLAAPVPGAAARPALAARLGRRMGSGPAIVLAGSTPAEIERHARAAVAEYRSPRFTVRREAGGGGAGVVVAVGRSGSALAAGQPQNREDLEEMVAIARLVDGTAGDGFAHHAWGVARPLAFDAREGLPGALDALASDAALLSRLRFVDAVVEVHTGEGHTVLDLREPLGSRAADRIAIHIAPGLARSFWLGELHEPLALLRGDLQVRGDLDALLRFLPALARLSRRVRMLVGATADAPPRLAVLTRFRIRCASLPGACGVATLAGGDPEERRLVAGLILLGLHPTCRDIELGMLRVAAEKDAAVASALSELERWLRRWLDDPATSALLAATPRIRSLPEARLEIS